MIKKFSITAALIAAIATLFILVPSCSKEKAQNEDSIVNPAGGQDPAEGEEDPAPETPEQPEEPVISILRVGLPEEQESSKAVLEFGYLEEFDTKVAIEQNDAGNLHTKWVEDDALRVGGKKSDDSLAESVYDIQEGFTDHIAEFAGEVPSGAVKDFYVIYPASVSYNLIYTYDYNGVKQVGNEGTSHLNYCAMIEGFDALPTSLLLTGRYATEYGLELRRSSTIKYRLKLPAEATTPTRIEFKADKVGAQEGSDRIFYFNNTADSKISTLTLYLQDVTPVSQVLTAYMSIPWQGYSVASGQDLTISVYYTTEGGDNKVVSKTFTPGAKTFGGNQTIIYQLNMTTGQSVATDAGGDGSSDHPYLLSTPEDLLSMKGKLLNGQKVYFKMTADIDMADIANWSPLNDSEINGFNRYIDFDGNGHLIKNLRCSDQKYASFFGVLCGECRNTGFVDANVNASGTSAGIVAANLGLDSPTKTAETGVIDQCYTSGYVTTNNSSVGGLAGQVGALSGSTKSTISNSYSSAVVEGNSCGGLTGYLKEGSLIQGSYFCGVNASPGAYWMGGIAAKTYSDGYDTKPIVNQCASLTKTSIAPHSGNNNVVFRIVRPNGMTVTNCKVWNGTNGNLRYSSDTQTNTLSEVQALFTTTLGSANGWSSTLDGDYPLLSWQVSRGDYATYAGHGRDYFDGGDGSESKPFLISKAYQLYNIEEHLNTSDTTYFKLSANVDLSDIDNWTPINQGAANDLLNLDGNGKTLSNLSLTNTSGYAGFFGILTGKVSDLTLKDFSVTQSSNNHGGILAGFLATTGSTYARVKNVTIDGGSVTMNGNSGVGSLGGNCGYAYISGCSSSATVVQNSNSNDTYGYAAGGLVGSTRHSTLTAVFENCSFSGSLTGYKYSGGILGLTAGGAGPRITECTFSGTVTNRARAASTGIDALTADSAGGIVGYHSRGILTDCTALAAGSVSGNDCIGGIIGYYYHTTAAFTFTRNNNYATISGHERVGGVVGSAYSTQGSQMSDCHSYFAEGNSISGNGSYCGGVIGWLRFTAAPASGYGISNFSSSARVQLTSSGNYAGGVIGYVAHDGSSSNHAILSMDNCSSSGTISSNNNTSGGIIGGMRGKKFSMTNCSSSATVNASAQYAGGLIAYLSGDYTSGDKEDISISDCTFSGTVNAGAYRCGGLVGQAYHCPGTMVRCRTVNPQGSTVSVTAQHRAGGLIGETDEETTLSLSDCSTQGSVEVSDTTAGGIIGCCLSKKLILDHCTNNASVTVAESGEESGDVHYSAGGIIGYLHGTNFTDDEDLSLTDCVNTGAVEAWNYAGGIIGHAWNCTLGSTLTRCTSSGDITARNRYASGVLGYSRKNTMTFSACGTTGSPAIQGDCYNGGIIGYINNQSSLTLSECSTSGSVLSTPNSSAGGLVGASYSDLTISDCTSAMNVTTEGSFAGGLIGYAYGNLTVSNSQSSGTIQARQYAGGLVGHSLSGTLSMTTSNHSGGPVRYDSSYASYAENDPCCIGGLVGRVSGGGSITQCYAKDCDVTGTYCIGGLVGYFAPTDSSTPTLTISESYYHGGTVRAEGTGNTRGAGGILGRNYSYTSAYDKTVIKDCYSRGTVITASGQVVGGIVGDAMCGTTVEYCISDCTVSAGRCAGGIIGRACNGGWSYSSNQKVKIENCICWSPSVTGTVTNNGSASSGAIIGFTSQKNWMYKCYYNPNMTFSGVNVKNTLVQQNSGKGYNTTYDGSTDEMVPGTTAGTCTTSPYTNVVPYHGGTVASSGRSACTVAQSIGFASRTNASSQPIWELFSGGTYNANFIMPELKQLRESSDSPGAISDLNKNSIFEEGDF